jgi:hypothetical protein
MKGASTSSGRPFQIDDDRMQHEELLHTTWVALMNKTILWEGHAPPGVVSPASDAEMFKPISAKRNP